GAESFSITIGGIRVNGTDADPSGSDWTLGRSVYTTTIAANDPHTFTLSCPSAVAESAGMLSCMVTHNGPALAEMTMLDWSIGTPNAAYTASVSDFSAMRAARNLGFPSGPGGVQFAQSAADGAQVTFQVPIENDSDGEEEERFVVAIQAPRNAAPTPVPLVNAVLAAGGTADVAIGDDDSPGVTIGADSVSVEAGMTATYTVMLNTEPSGDVTVTPASDNGAVATVSGALTFTDDDGATPWSTAQDVIVTGAAAGTASISHTVAGGGYDSVTVASVAVTVTAVVTGPQFSIAVASSVTDADSNADNGVQVGEDVGSIAFTVSLGGAAITDDVTVQWAVTGVDTATDLSGYPTTAAERTLTFTTTDQAAKTVTLSVVDDTAYEAPETLTVTLSAAAGTDNPTITSASAQVQITNNDPPFFVTPQSLTVTAGETAEYTVRLAYRPSGEVGIIPSSGDTAVATLMYNRFLGRNNDLFWGNNANWTDSYTVTVTGVAAGSTTITNVLDSGSGNYPSSLTVPSVAVTVTAAASAPAFQIAVAATVADADNAVEGTQVGEDVGTVAFSVSVGGAAPTADITVDWAASGVDTATDLSGYPSSRTLTFTMANHATAQTISLTVADDSLNEALETLTVTLSNAGGADSPTIGTAAAAVQITDNDAITVTIANQGTDAD
ncbi:MAG: hypothetical protein OXU61_03770, partial [Gammaproteobacteria bacterium]|nr:hypothetical protein [Gammaproteobacteria bacterium]